MEALGIVALVVVIVVAAVLVLAAMRPDTFEIRRSTRITAPPDRIFPLIADFHRWSAWSPFEKLDPAMTRTFGGAASGTGATYAWDGNRKAGQGRMEIIDAVPPSLVRIAIDFLRPFKASNVVDFTLNRRGRHDRDLGHARSGAVSGQDHASRRQRGPHGGTRLRTGTHQSQAPRRKPRAAATPPL